MFTGQPEACAAQAVNAVCQIASRRGVFAKTTQDMYFKARAMKYGIRTKCSRVRGQFFTVPCEEYDCVHTCQLRKLDSLIPFSDFP